MIDIRNVTKSYGPKVAVQDLTLHVPAGELFAFLDQLLLLGRHFQCGAILVAGDLFHNKAQVGWYVLHRLLSWGLQVRESGIELLTISGNHDQKDDRYESLQQTPYGVLVAHADQNGRARDDRRIIEAEVRHR